MATTVMVAIPAPLPVQAIAVREHEEDDEQMMPPLVQSLAIPGLPPRAQSKFLDEAKKLTMEQIANLNIIKFDSYWLLGLSSASFLYSNAASVDRLMVGVRVLGLTFLLDDMFFDTPDEFPPALLHEQYGIDPCVRDSPEKTKACLDHLCYEILSREEPLPESAPALERIIWEIGRDVRRLSNPEWFSWFVDNVNKFQRAGVDSQAKIAAGGSNSDLQDVESYMRMRIANAGGDFAQNLSEVTNNNFVPTAMRANRFMRTVTNAFNRFISLINDVFSYHKESMIEANPRNLISVLIDSEGLSLAQAVRKAIRLVNEAAQSILDLEHEALCSSTELRYLQGIKEVCSGLIFYHAMHKRYRHPDSIFPELRDTNVGKVPRISAAPEIPYTSQKTDHIVSGIIIDSDC